ncbi:FAD binding domain-containing protein [Pectinatus cerevisiiphilus]|uniref:CO/xanthine dehydrogenase FAD-binding subunit n=1 Tax=Pectinatus cerevisiiphilus TaxID=86956 RepID=A0A4R3K891_9FIRM|nr:FAD binding domain-containing protein [Pectinatus cerevisiiphilus]TCS79003.1 CO/xanthine dehydrogenase FAD-binding subunit [Pectinatus cerevisiiphilus]
MVKSFFPVNLAEAMAFCKQKNICPIAGGTDLMVRNHRGTGILPAFSANMLFTKNIAEMNVLRREDTQLFIGANTTLAQLIKWQYTPRLLRMALLEMAAPAVRNVGTLAGNICNASPAGDTLPPLYAMDAVVCLQAPAGKRELPIKDFITGPGKTVLHEDELLVGVKLPFLVLDNELVFYKKVAMRKAAAISKVSLAMRAIKKNGYIESVAVAIGAVGPVIVRLPAVEVLAAGKKALTQELLKNIYSEYDKAIRPIDDVRSTAAYRKRVAMNLLQHVYEHCIK